MKKVLLLTLFLSGTMVFAQMPEVDYPYADLIEEGNFEKAEKKITKKYNKDSNDVLYCYAFFRLKSANTYSGFDVDSSYDLIVRTYELYKLLEEKPQKKLAKKNLTEERILYDIQQTTGSWLQKALSTNRIDLLDLFLKKFGRFASESQIKTATKKRNALEFRAAKEINTEEAYQAFIDRRSDAEDVSKAIQLRNEMAYLDASKKKTIESYGIFIEKYPDAKQVADARKRIHKIAYDEACKENTLQSFRDYLEKYPESEYSPEAKKKMDSFDFFKSEIKLIVVYPEEFDIVLLDGFEDENGNFIEGVYHRYYGDSVWNIPEVTVYGEAIAEVYRNFVSSDTTFIENNIAPMTDSKYGIVRGTRYLEVIDEKIMKLGDPMEISIDIEKLITYVRDKGVVCDLVDHSWDFEMRRYNFFKSRSEFGMRWLIEEMTPWESNVFDVSLVVKPPKPIKGSSQCSIPVQFEYRSNKHTLSYYMGLLEYLRALAIPESLVAKYKELGYEIYAYNIVDYSKCYFGANPPYDGKLMIDDIRGSGSSYYVNLISSGELYFYDKLREEEMNKTFALPLFDFKIKDEGKSKIDFFFCEDEIDNHFKRGFIDCCTPYGVWEKSKFGYVSNVVDGIIGLRLPSQIGEVIHRSDDFEIIIPQSLVRKIKKLYAWNRLASEEDGEGLDGIIQHKCVEKKDSYKINLNPSHF